jgi:fumarate hydratase subunit beta
MKKINAPLKDKDIKGLKAGDEVLLSGVIFTARDQAHLKISRMMEKGKRVPVDLKGQVIYYCGPTPPGERVIGSCGPTTSGRMDSFSCALLDAGLKGMIGKGARNDKVRASIKKNRAVYFVAPAGAGAYLSVKVKSSEPVAFREMGPEAVYRLEVKDFPLIVAIDASGRDIYKRFGPARKK